MLYMPAAPPSWTADLRQLSVDFSMASSNVSPPTWSLSRTITGGIPRVAFGPYISVGAGVSNLPKYTRYVIDPSRRQAQTSTRPVPHQTAAADRRSIRWQRAPTAAQPWWTSAGMRASTGLVRRPDSAVRPEADGRDPRQWGRRSRERRGSAALEQGHAFDGRLHCQLLQSASLDCRSSQRHSADAHERLVQLLHGPVGDGLSAQSLTPGTQNVRQAAVSSESAFSDAPSAVSMVHVFRHTRHCLTVAPGVVTYSDKPMR